MKMEDKYFALWNDGKRVLLFHKATEDSLEMDLDEWHRLLGFLGPLVETAYPPLPNGESDAAG